MHIYESLVVEELVDCESHLVTDAVDGSECIGSWTEVSYCSEELE